MPNWLRRHKVSHRLSLFRTARAVTAWMRWHDAKLNLKDRLYENCWGNPRRREFRRKRVFPSYFS
jgi:hypothetical protein